MKNIFFKIVLLWLVTSVFSYAETIELSIVKSDGVTEIGATSTKNTASTGSTHIDKKWRMEYDHDLLLIPSNDLIIPIEIDVPTVTMISEDHNLIRFTADGTVRSVTRTPVVQYDYETGSTFSYRPTLFVSIGGFVETLSGDGHGVSPWQYDMETELANSLSTYQYRHFIVNWDTHKRNRNQVKDLADVIKGFLKSKLVAWDVVVVGHSRGGIFTHELTKKLVGYSKIKNLHSFLLDPTANGAPLNDFYPKQKYNESPTKHYGSLYYDGKPVYSGVNIGTIGDIDIPGYNNYNLHPHKLNSTHQEFGNDWVVAVHHGLIDALEDIKDKKDIGVFAEEEGGSGCEVVKISAHEDGIHFDGGIEYVDGNVHLWGDISIADAPGANATLDIMVGDDGLAFTGATALGATQIILDKDSLDVAASIPLSLSELSGTINKDGLSIDITTPIVNIGADLGTGSNITLDIPGVDENHYTDQVKNAFKKVCSCF